MLTTLALEPSCLTQLWVSSNGGTDSALVLGNPHDTGCWPAGRDLATTISPAICPSGYVSACDITSSHSTDETVWACCPTQFSCDGGYYSCVSGLKPGDTRVYTVTDTDRLGNTFTTTLSGDGGVNAHSIKVAFHSSDIIATSTSTPGDSANLSTGAAGGVGVGVGIGVFLLCSGVSWLVLRRYRRKRLSTARKQDAPQQLLGLDSRGYRMDPLSMGITELDGAPRLQELGTKRKTGELPAS
ncbi:hypothetical protein F4813DRAFT_364225 [Daldinia decipiens]|uniref:uncharacterized protein n=1 Tax=Daldinia decipiens TaxID=326647 RepID=UPI0020C2EF9A|nr:uncharacterized protein F4813DRAFT_364225 [Daldinia decipiens]KAI1656393.1 hypothetical protein F4813DRAFT_364225 [Daldinia decipiens]